MDFDEPERDYWQEYKDDLAMGDPKEEPDCGGCGDSGQITVDAAGQPVPAWDNEHAVAVANCPDCNPTPEQHAAQLAAAERARAEFDRRVAAGEITYDESAPF